MQKEILAKRLAYLWDLRDKDPYRYVENGFGIEKEDLYSQYGNDKEFMTKAYEIYNRMGRSIE